MGYPIYKIEVYTGSWVTQSEYANNLTLKHTITDEVIDKLRIKSMFSIPGNFDFTLPLKKGFNSVYADIKPFDTVKIYVGMDKLSSSPSFVGRIENISNQYDAETKKGIRVFSGRDLAEVTTRRVKWQYNTGGTEAHNAVASWCDDTYGLGFGTSKVAADSTYVWLTSFDSKYDSLLKDIGDYAATISKDWYVDTNYNLVWQARPLRTQGVSSLTLGEGSILKYILTKGLQNQVYNNFHVFGASEPHVDGTSACSHDQYTKAATDIPADHDSWTEATTDWSITSGDSGAVLDVNNAFKHLGAHAVWGYYTGAAPATGWILMTRPFPWIMIKDRATLQLVLTWTIGLATLTGVRFDILAPDSSNYFFYTMDASHFPADNTSTHYSVPIGASYVSNSGTEVWAPIGHPDWRDMEGFRCFASWNSYVSGTLGVCVDGLYFSDLRWYAADDDSASITETGQRDMTATYDVYHSNSECSNAAAQVKAWYKSVLMQLDILTSLDTNIQLGDRIPITLPDETDVDGSPLSGVNFDVIRVEHLIQKDKAHTQTMLTSIPTNRDPIKTTDSHTLLREVKQHSLAISKGQYVTK